MAGSALIHGGFRHACGRTAAESALPRSGGSFGRQEPRDGNVFIDRRPVDTDPVSDEPPVVSLVRCCSEETREPGQGSGHSATIGEPDDQLFIRDFHVRSPVLSGRSTHSTPSRVPLPSLRGRGGLATHGASSQPHPRKRGRSAAFSSRNRAAAFRIRPARLLSPPLPSPDAACPVAPALPHPARTGAHDERATRGRRPGV